MSRLTYKLDNQEQEEHKTKYLKFEYFPIPDYCIEKGNSGRITSDMIYNKLGQLEDLEEQIGCPLEVVFKALMNGIYNGCGEYLVCSIWNFRGICMLEVSGGSYPTDEYKKTWWLREDKSE